MAGKNKNFIRLAEKRLMSAIHSIEILKPLANKNCYEYTENQANYIIKKLKDSVTTLEKSFKNNTGREKSISIPRDEIN